VERGGKKKEERPGKRGEKKKAERKAKGDAWCGRKDQSMGVFTSRTNPKYFLFHPSHRIFGRMHETLNVGKKDN
jgi:hypothetical protein